MKYPIIWFAIIIHFIWGALLFASPTTQNVTGLNLLYQIIPNRFVLGVVLICCSTLALVAVTKYDKIKSLVMLLPQQFLLVIPALQVITIISQGHFADGVVRDRSFLLADKVGIILLALIHTITLLNFHKLNNVKE